MNAWIEMLLANSATALLLAAVALLAHRMRASSSFVHCLWLLVLLKLVTPPLFELPVKLPELAVPVLDPRITEAAREASGAAASVSSNAPPVASEVAAIPRMEVLRLEPVAPAPTAPPIDWVLWACIAWAIGTLSMLVRAFWRAGQFGRILAHARPANSALQLRARRLADNLGLRRMPAVLVVPARISPMIWSFFGRPRLVLPERLVRDLDAGVVDTLLAHELAHVRRGDHWVRHLELLVRAVHWWNPLVWWAAHRMRVAEEECCDAWVVWALPDGRRRYAEALVGTVEFLSQRNPGLPAGASGVGRVDNLKRRITMIMQGQSRRMLSRSGRLALVAFAALFLPLMPAVGQDVERERAEAELRNRLEAGQARIADLSAHIAALESELAAASKANKRKNSADLRKRLADLEVALVTRRDRLAQAEVELAQAEERLARDPRRGNRGARHEEYELHLRFNVHPNRLRRSLGEAVEVLAAKGDRENAEILQALAKALRTGGRPHAAHDRNDFERARATLERDRERLEREREALNRDAEHRQMEMEMSRRMAELEAQRNAMEAERHAMEAHAEAARREAEHAREHAEHQIRDRMREHAEVAEHMAHRLDEIRAHGEERVHRLERRVEELSDAVRRLAEIAERRERNNDNRREREGNDRREEARDRARAEERRRRRNRDREPENAAEIR